MLYVVTGVSGSGKSEYAERLAVRLSGGAGLYYAAAMQPYGEEGAARIARHREMRSGKHFQTIERYRDIGRITEEIGVKECKEATILLECMSNLLANEMFGLQEQEEENGRTAEEHSAEKRRTAGEHSAGQERASAQSTAAADKLLSETFAISRQCKHLIVVTNEVFADGVLYADQTEQYRRQLARINRCLVEQADEAVEVVYTIPVRLRAKGTDS